MSRGEAVKKQKKQRKQKTPSGWKGLQVTFEPLPKSYYRLKGKGEGVMGDRGNICVVASGTFTFVNRHPRALDSVLVTIAQPEVRVDTLAWDRPATVLVSDSALGTRICQLTTPLAPGDTIHLRYRARCPEGLRQRRSHHGRRRQRHLRQLPVLPDAGLSGRRRDQRR